MELILKYLKKLVIFTVTQLIALTFTFLVIFSIGFYAIKEVSKTVKIKNDEIVKDNSYLTLDLTHGITEKQQDFDINFFSDKIELGFYDIINSIDKAKKDSKIKGIIIQLDKINISSGQRDEIIEKLIEFKNTGKTIYAFGDYINNFNYPLGIIANKLYMSKSASNIFNLTGYSNKQIYYKDFFDKIGIKYKVIHQGEFKTYGENYVKNKMSPQLRTEYSRILNSRFNDFVTNIATIRKLDKTSFKNNLLDGKFALLDGKEAKELGLIDEIMFFHDMVKKNKIDNQITIAKYISSKPNHKNNHKKIAIIYAQGPIMESDLENHKVVSSHNMISEIDRVIEDDNIKGVIIRVNSPGGSALSSEIILSKIIDLKKKKPVYISMGDVAASGGYYISAHGQKVFATNKTITGSIGVVSMAFNAKVLIGKIGLNIEKIEDGKYSDLFDIDREISDEEIALLKKSQKRTYLEFKNRVSTGRNLEMNKLESIAQGKIWTAKEAKKNGLIDDIASLDQVVKIMAKDLKLKNYNVINIKKETDKFDGFRKMKKFLTIKIYGNGYLNMIKYLDQIKTLNKKVLMYDNNYMKFQKL